MATSVNAYFVPWKTVHDLDAGGALAQAKAADILGKLAAAGCWGTRIDHLDNVASAWLAAVFATAGIHPCIDIGYGSSWKKDAVVADNTDILHTSQSGEWDPGETKWFCPGYRGTIWDEYVAWVEALVALWSPERVWCDFEIFSGTIPPVAAHLAFINTCSRCGGWGAYNTNRAAFATAIEAVIDAEAGESVPIYYYGAAATGWWWPANTGDGMGLPFYWYYHDQYGSGRCPAQIVESHIKGEDLTGAHVWVSSWKKVGTPALGMWDLTAFRAGIQAIVDAGAEAFIMYPGPFKDDPIDTTSAENTALLARMAVIADVLAP